MLKRLLLPRQDNFFLHFQQSADKLLLASTEFSNMLQHLDNQQHYVDLIARHEEEADDVAHANFELLHKTFITPFDRHDMHQLISTMDDIIDLINRIGQRFPFYNLQTVPPEAIKLAQLSMEAAGYLKQTIYLLNSLRNSDQIFQYCKQIDKVESRAHQVVLAGEKHLFMNEQDFKQFFKIKEIYSYTKRVINRYQDVANIVKGIILEYS